MALIQRHRLGLGFLDFCQLDDRTESVVMLGTGMEMPVLDLLAWPLSDSYIHQLQACLTKADTISKTQISNRYLRRHWSESNLQALSWRSFAGL
jgi:hypothetical protein